MLDAMEFAQCTPSLSQALRIKKLSSDGNLTVRDMEDILSEIKQKEIDRVVFKTEQLPKHYFRIFRLIFSNSLPPRVLWVRSLLLLPADAFFRYCPGVQPLC